MPIKWIQTGMQLGQAVKNVQRLRQITTVFAKHGFADIVDRMDLGRYLSGRLAAYAEAQADRTTPERLRMAFEELGPTFVKLGQLLSTRSDLLPEPFIEEFTHLQSNVKPLPFTIVQATIEAELKKKIDAAYSTINPVPLAAASIAQVHEATLLSGEKVVIKVQRPEIEKIIETDISLLVFLAGLLEKYIPESRVVRPKVIVEEFFRTLSFELDFVIEANNIVRITENMASIPEVVIPKVYKSLSTQRVLTLEQFEGIRVNDLKRLDETGVDRKKVVEIGARAFFKSILIDGLFHGDLHGGNLFILPGDRLGIVDFGMVGRLSEKSRDQLANMMMYLVTEDYENLCYEYAELGAAGSSVDFDAFQREVRNTVSPYTGLALSEMNIGKILIESTKIATKYNIKVPGDWMLVFKAILTIEGMGRTLDPEFDLFLMGQELAKDLVKNQYSAQRLSKEFLWLGKDVAALFKVLPRQIRWMFRKLNSNDFVFEIKSPDFQDIKNQLDINGKRMSGSIVVAGMLIAGSLSLNYNTNTKLAEIPLISAILLGCSCIILIKILTISSKK